MYSKGFCYTGKTIFKCGRQNGRQKRGFLSNKRVFDRIKLSNIQKNRAFMRCFCIINRFWCGRQELKTCDDTKKALIFKAFFLSSYVFNSCRPHQNRVFMRNERINTRFFCIFDSFMRSKMHFFAIYPYFCPPFWRPHFNIIFPL